MRETNTHTVAKGCSEENGNKEIANFAINTITHTALSPLQLQIVFCCLKVA